MRKVKLANLQGSILLCFLCFYDSMKPKTKIGLVLIQKNLERHEAATETYQSVSQPAIKDLCYSLKSSWKVKIVQSSSSSWPFDLLECPTQVFVVIWPTSNAWHKGVVIKQKVSISYILFFRKCILFHRNICRHVHFFVDVFSESWDLSWLVRWGAVVFSDI